MFNRILWKDSGSSNIVVGRMATKSSMTFWIPNRKTLKFSVTLPQLYIVRFSALLITKEAHNSQINLQNTQHHLICISQMKAKVRYKSKIWKRPYASEGIGTRKRGILFYCCWEYQMKWPLWKTTRKYKAKYSFAIMSNIHILNDKFKWVDSILS